MRIPRKREASIIFASLLFTGASLISTRANASGCDEAVANTLSVISSKGGTIEKVGYFPVETKSPFPGSKHLRISLDSSGKARVAVANIMNSPLLNMDLAKKVLLACPGVSSISFHVWNTDEMNTFYRFRDGAVRRHVCVNDFSQSGWGYGPCP